MINSVITTVSAVAAANPLGFTYNVESSQMQTTGYAVALEITQDSHGIDGLESVINIVMSGEYGATCVGGWLDQNTGLYYYDATVIIEDRETAEAFGRLQRQIAIFDLNNLQEIRL